MSAAPPAKAANVKAPPNLTTPSASPKAVAPPPIGLLPNGTPVFAPFQPSVASLALALTPFLRTSDGLAEALPLPSGLSLHRPPEGRQIQLTVAPFFVKKLRMIFGNVGEIALSDGDGTGAPAQLTVALRIPRKHGPTTAEKDNSRILVRHVAFVSKSLFEKPAHVVKLGSCVTGFLEPSSGRAKSCQLVGWGFSSLDIWRSTSPSTVPNQFDFNMDALFFIPQLSGTNFEYTRLPHVS